MVKLDYHQVIASCDLIKVLEEHKFAILNAEMRTGKTLTIIDVANKLQGTNNIKSFLIITKKGAINSIQKDIDSFGSDKLVFTVINYESLHKIDLYYDFVVADEYHTLGYVGRPKLVNKRMAKLKYKYFVGMTGTLFLETFSTAYSLLPCFQLYKNFYQWAKVYVDIKQKRIGQHLVNDYTKIKDVDLIMKIAKPYIVTVTQEQAGFQSKVEDKIHKVSSIKMENACKEIKKNKKYKIDDSLDIIADNISKEFQIIKQLQSGIIKVGEDRYCTLDNYKFDFMMTLFKDTKICVFYEYIGERILLENEFKKIGYTVTDSPEIFNSSDYKTVFIGQFVSKREGINLSSCNDLIFFSMPYSNLTYLQTRERCILKNKTETVRCHFLCTEFEKKVYDIVKIEKGKFNTETYKRI